MERPSPSHLPVEASLEREPERSRPLAVVPVADTRSTPVSSYPVELELALQLVRALRPTLRSARGVAMLPVGANSMDPELALEMAVYAYYRFPVLAAAEAALVVPDLQTSER